MTTAPSSAAAPALAQTPLLSVAGLSVTYRLAGGRSLQALRGVDLSLERGETLAIVGESGSGKTTLVRAALRLFDVGVKPSVSGTVTLEGRDLFGLSERELRALRRRAQLVFQDPYASLDPRMRIASIVAEPLAIHRIGKRSGRIARALELLGQVGLSESIAWRFPSALSGGQRQRVGIARALAVDPELLVLDEPLSALDVSVQAQVINLLVDLRERRGLAYLLIAHDLRLVRYLAPRVAVMYLGRIVETGPTEQVLGAPRHPYTQLLVSFGTVDAANRESSRGLIPLPRALEIEGTPEPLVRALRGEAGAAAALLSRLAGPPGLAAFDADGTLWDGDLGEAVLRNLIARRQLLNPPRDPWGGYLRLFEVGPAEAFAYAGQLMAGLSEVEVRETSARIFAAEFAPRVFRETRWLLETLVGKGWEVYIVSASNRWSIEVAAEVFGLAGDRVVALDLETERGILTDRVCLPVPTLEGKPALFRARSSRELDLAFGNSTLDIPLLLTAGVPVAVGLLPAQGPATPGDSFLAQAAQRGWARLEIPAA